MHQTIEILIKEHQLIERMILVAQKKLAEMKGTNQIDPNFIDLLGEFFISFIDRVHQNKEEKVIFEELYKRELFELDKETMTQLRKDHGMGMDIVKKIIDAKQRYVIGDISGFDELKVELEKFINLYIPHIKIENEKFFPDAMNYFNDEEKEELTKKFQEYDNEMELQKYTLIVESLEKENS